MHIFISFYFQQVGRQAAVLMFSSYIGAECRHMADCSIRVFV